MVYIEYETGKLKNEIWTPENYSNERWVVISDSDGNFLISDYGRVKRLEHDIIYSNGYKKHFCQSIINVNFNKGNKYLYAGYRGVDLKPRNCSVHRLVALHFVKNEDIEKYKQVNHIFATADMYGKTINHYKNLEWCTPKQNCEHSVRTGLFNFDSEKRKKQCVINSKMFSYKNWTKIIEYNCDGVFIKIHNGLVNLIRDKNIKISTNRLSYGNCFYLDYNVVMKKYNCIPKYIDFKRVNNVRNQRRHVYYEYTCGEKINTYISIKDLPISRDELYYAFLHDIKDKNLSKWNILNANESNEDVHYSKYFVNIHNDSGSITFETTWECANWLKNNLKLSAKINSVMQVVNRSKKSYGYNIEKILKVGDTTE